MKRKAGKKDPSEKIQASRKKRDKKEQRSVIQISEFKQNKFAAERERPPIQPLNARQADYLSALQRSAQLIVTGPAGTGKTWIAACHAADLFRKGKVAKIKYQPISPVNQEGLAFLFYARNATHNATFC